MPPLSYPQVAIVGRPNVGKSSLLNRFAGRRVSIVDPTPGVTRDRVSTIIEINAPTDTPKGTPAKTVEIMDTGGYGVYTAEGKRFDDVGADLSTLTADIERQIQAAIRQADLILFVIDAQDGVTALDQTIATLIRKAGAADKVMLLANKVDDEGWVAEAQDAARLGFGEPQPISASNSFGFRRVSEAIYAWLDQHVGHTDAHVPPPSDDIKIAIVGKRNSGKSTLINAWAGEPRVIVSEIAGTTRDSVDVRFEIDGRSLLAIDTAGVRKRKSFADDIEFYAHTRMEQSIKRADVVLLLLDATAEVSQVDQKLAQTLLDQAKPTVMVINKWDLAEGKHTTDDYVDYLTQQLRGLEFAPIVFISAKTGEGLRDLAAMAFNLHQQASHRESTGRLNAAIKDIMSQRGPSAEFGSRRAKLLYASQVDVNPPTIVLVVNEPKLFEGQYERYLMNELRERLPFSEVPMRLRFKKRERVDLDELKARGRGRGAEDQ